MTPLPRARRDKGGQRVNGSQTIARRVIARSVVGGIGYGIGPLGVTPEAGLLAVGSDGPQPGLTVGTESCARLADAVCLIDSEQCQYTAICERR